MNVSQGKELLTFDVIFSTEHCVFTEQNLQVNVSSHRLCTLINSKYLCQTKVHFPVELSISCVDMLNNIPV